MPGGPAPKGIASGEGAPAGRLHPLAVLHALRYGLLLCLVPMVRALFVFDLAALWTALQQDAAILLLCAAAAVWLWRHTAFRFCGGALEVRHGFFFCDTQVISAQSVAALTVTRPLFYRFCGAATLTLYFARQQSPRSCALTLSRKDAQRLADALLPARTGSAGFAPAGYEKLALVMLSANVLTTCLFVFLSLRRVSGLLGADWKNVAQWNLSHLELLFARFLPAGTAMFTALVFLIASVTLVATCLRTAGFSVCRCGGALVNRGGLLTKTERRVRLGAITALDVRVTPAARLLRRYPVYVSAGSFCGGELPLVVCRRGLAELFALVPGFTVPAQPLCTPRRKSVVQYLWKPGIVLGLDALLCAAAVSALPQMLPVLAVPAVLSAGSLLLGLDGYFHEGAAPGQNRTLHLCFVRWFTRHSICVLTPDAVFDTFQHPIALNAGRADVRIHLPCGLTWRVRGMAQAAAHRLSFPR